MFQNVFLDRAKMRQAIGPSSARCSETQRYQLTPKLLKIEVKQKENKREKRNEN